MAEYTPSTTVHSGQVVDTRYRTLGLPWSSPESVVIARRTLELGFQLRTIDSIHISIVLLVRYERFIY